MKANLNTILVAVCLAVLSWMAYTTHTSSVGIAAINATMVASKEKDSTQDIALAELRTRITAVEVELAKLKEHKS